MVWACDDEREEHYAGRRVIEMKVGPTKDNEGRKISEKIIGQSEGWCQTEKTAAGEVYDRATRRCMASYIDPNISGDKVKKTKEDK